jgi:cell division septal protein FtsQ
MPPRPQGRNTRRVPPATTRDRRLLRARDGGHRASRSWRVRLWTALRVGTMALVLAGSGWYVQDVMTSGEAFAVVRLKTIGNSRLSEGEVEGLLGGLKGRNIVTTSLEPWRQRLLSSPWVRDASLRRALPGTIEVRITERVPMAVARSGDSLLLIDEQGAIVDEFGPRYRSLDLPIVEGLMERDGREAAADEARIALVSAALVSLRDARLLERVSQLDVNDARNVAVMLMHDPVRLQLGREHFGERVQAYLDMKDRLARMVTQVESVDLRFENRVYVRPRKPGTTFASMPQVPVEDAVEEALAEPEDVDGQQ